jgi:hypothetical protein
MKTKMMLMTLATLVSAQSFGAQLACWNLYAKKGAKPTVTADIVRDDELQNLKINFDDNFSFDTTGMSTSAVASEVTAKASPYLGLNQFVFSSGVRLILPKNLSNDSLASTSIKAGNGDTARQNGVLDVAGGLFPTKGSGDIYTRMHCVSK